MCGRQNFPLIVNKMPNSNEITDKYFQEKLSNNL